MEPTFDKALDRILELVNGEIDVGDLQPEGPKSEDIEGEPEVEKTPTPGVSVNSEQIFAGIL